MIKANYLDGQLLLAMPNMADPRFDRSVIYICSHTADGAMGLVINAGAVDINFPDLLDQLDVLYDDDPLSRPGQDKNDITIHRGGPVEVGRGFILHSADYIQETSLIISETIVLTATVDIISAIAEGKGPKKFVIALGYTGWGAGQLEQEMTHNAWLNVEADDELIFRTDLDLKWPRAMAKMGIDIAMLSSYSGNA